MPFLRPLSFTRSSAARAALLFSLSLCGVAALSAQAETRFAITRSAHETYPISVCANEFGQGYRVANWWDIEVQYRETGSLDKFFSQTGLASGGTAQVMLDGQPRWRNDPARIFFIERHDGRKPDHFLAHAQIAQHQLSLGSWMGARPVLCVQSAQAAVQPKIPGSGKPTANVPFGLTRRSWEKAGEYDSISDKVCVDEFGPGHLIADWQDIDAWFNDTGSLEAFFAHTGLEDAYVTQWDKLSFESATGKRIFYATKNNMQLGILATISDRSASASLKLVSWPTDMDRGGGGYASQYGGPLNVLCTVPSRSIRTALPKGFARTQKSYSSYSDNTCVSEFGKAYRIADWGDIEFYKNKTGSLEEFYAQTGLKKGDSAWVTTGGKPYRTVGQYAYFIERHDGAQPLEFRSHANINNHQLDLGSGDEKRPVMCVQATLNRAPVTASPKAPPKAPPQASTSGCGSIKDESLRNFCRGMSVSGVSCGDIKNNDLRNTCLANCSGVKNPDMRSFCVGIGKSISADCGGVKNPEWRNLCIGVGRSLAADCGAVRNNDLRTTCREIRDHRRYEEGSERRGGGWFW
ncbi:MAG: hypothetical protein LBL72_07120 [Candidatus Accumulibacter sp.]|jgi:hypothetical protein|nr:hypothetical protein [Accumulibacter sp.]